MTEPSSDDFIVRHLTRQLANARALGDNLYEEGYAAGRRHNQLEVPEEFAAALRHGSAQQHVDIPVEDGLTTIVLAQDGSGWPDERREAETWASLERLRATVVDQTQPGIEYIQRQELPSAIAAVIWRWAEHTAVVATTAGARPRLRSALRAHRTGFALAALVIGWLVRAGKAIAHGLVPSATTAAASMAAVTAIATAPPVGVPTLERGRSLAAHSGSRQSPLAYHPGAQPRVRKKQKAAAPGAAAATDVPPTQPPVEPPALPPVDPPQTPAPTPTPDPTPTDGSPPTSPPSATGDPTSPPSTTDPVAAGDTRFIL